MNKHKTLARRELLTLMGLTATPFMLSPVDRLLEMISADVLDKAMAQTIPQMSKTRRMISVALVGAPPRHLWDLFLKPTANAPFNQNPGFGTRIRPDGTAAFDTYDFNLNGRTVTLPYIWQFPIAAKSGWRPMTDLLPNMLSIRGIDLENDGHAPAQTKWDAPIPGGPSISGLIADTSVLPLGCIINNFGPKAASFRSPSGAGYTKSSTATPVPPLALLMAPFSLDQTGDAKKLADQSEIAIDRALDRLKYLSEKSTLGTSGAYIDLKKTRTLMKRAVGGLDAEWARLLGKYQDLLIRSIRPNAAVSIPGITTALGGSDRGSNAYRLTPDGLSTYRIGNANLGTLMNEATVAEMAEQFALTEYVMMNDLADASYMQMVRFHNVRVENAALETTPNTVIPAPFMAAIHFDAHEVGVVPATITFSMFFRALSSCMLELMDTLKTK
ncbi:MAG: hypothetical protein K2X47_17880, partial [Bdellovibrionales bacterium]|nr:hypothetical protein [Bdellovibrionales bacterium]